MAEDKGVVLIHFAVRWHKPVGPDPSLEQMPKLTHFFFPYRMTEQKWVGPILFAVMWQEPVGSGPGPLSRRTTLLLCRNKYQALQSWVGKLGIATHVTTVYSFEWCWALIPSFLLLGGKNLYVPSVLGSLNFIFALGPLSPMCATG